MSHFLRSAAVILVSVLLLFLAACCSQSRTSTAEPALVAKSYAQEKFGFKKPQVGSVHLLNDYYSVWVWEQPRKPGGFVIIHVSEENKVIGWEPGR
jgi:hypothetical protein